MKKKKIKRRKLKIPPKKKGKRALEADYSKLIIKLLADLYPDDGFNDNSTYSRIAVTDLKSGYYKKREYGVVGVCNETIVSLVEAFEGIDKSVLMFCIEGLTVGINQLQVGGISPKKLKAIVYDNSPGELEDEILLVNKSIAENQPFILSISEYADFQGIFKRSKNGEFPVRIFNKESNPQAAAYFIEAKKLLKRIPSNRRHRM